MRKNLENEIDQQRREPAALCGASSSVGSSIVRSSAERKARKACDAWLRASNCGVKHSLRKNRAP